MFQNLIIFSVTIIFTIFQNILLQIVINYIGEYKELL